jgi:tetratricopeptide (TPR) repeat protein
MFSTNILVRFTFILVTCSSLGLAQRSEPASGFSVSGQNVNYPVDIPETPYVFIFLNGRAARGPAAVGGNRVVDIRQLTAHISKQALNEYEKAVLEIKDHNTQRAIERLEKSVGFAPDFYNAHLYLAQEYRKTGRLDAAEQEFTRAFDLNPREGTPLIQLGEIYLEKSNFKRAAEVLSQAIRIEPGSAVAHYALGRARYRLSEYAEAEQAFTRAALLDKDFEGPELMLLQVYVRQGKLSAALSGMDALLQKNPGKNPALEKFRSEVVIALANSKQGAEKPK